MDAKMGGGLASFARSRTCYCCRVSISQCKMAEEMELKEEPWDVPFGVSISQPPGQGRFFWRAEEEEREGRDLRPHYDSECP